MSLASCPLPDNPAELRAFALALQNRNQVLEDELYAKTLHIEKLKMQLAALRRARFGRSSEKLDRDDRATRTADRRTGRKRSPERGKPRIAAAHGQSGPVAAVTIRGRRKCTGAQAAAGASAARARRASGRLRLPACGGTRLTCIGTDEREVLEYVPSHFKVIVHARPKMSCRDCETITQPPMPSLPIERGAAGAGLARPCDRVEILRSSAAASAVGDLWRERRRDRPLDHGRLGRADGFPSAAAR